MALDIKQKRAVLVPHSILHPNLLIPIMVCLKSSSTQEVPITLNNHLDPFITKISTLVLEYKWHSKLINIAKTSLRLLKE